MTIEKAPVKPTSRGKDLLPARMLAREIVITIEAIAKTDPMR